MVNEALAGTDVSSWGPRDLEACLARASAGGGMGGIGVGHGGYAPPEYHHSHEGEYKHASGAAAAYHGAAMGAGYTRF